MAEGGGISYRIELDSAEAEQALNKLQGAAEGLAGSFQKMASAVSEGGLDAVAKLAEAAAVAVVGLTTGLFGMAKAASANVDELGQMAAQVGSTIEQMSTLKSALVSFQANGDTLMRGFQRMGNAIQDVWPGIQKSVADASKTIVEDQNNIIRASQAVQQALFAQEQAHTALARSSQDAAQQQVSDALAIVSARQSVRNAEIALVQARGQTVSAEILERNKIKNAELALVAARQKAAEAEAKAARDAEDAAARRAQLLLQQVAAEQALADAKEKRAAAEAKQQENQINSIENLKTRVDAISKGAAAGGLSVDNMIKGLIASVGLGTTSLEGFGASFREVTKGAPELRGVMFKLADVFEHTKDSALKMAIATKLFGRKDAKDMVESLSEGSAALKAEEERMRALGLVITDVDEKISKKFIRGMNQLGNAIGIVGTQFGLLFQPAFTTLLDGIRIAVESNRASIIAWGEAIRDTVGPVLESLGRALVGIPQAGKDDWAVRMIESIKTIGTAAVAVFGGIVMPLFRGLLQMAEGVAFGINKIFGTAFTGLEILVMAVIARLALAFATMLLGAGPVGLAIIGIGLALGLLITYWPQISAAAKATWEVIVAAAGTAKQFIMDWVTTPIAGAWQWIVDTFNAAIDWVVEKAKKSWEFLKSLFTSGPGGATQPAAAAGGGAFAGGGLLGGRGTGTSDSNLAWVSRGEYITPARAVAQPGVLAFLEALRLSGGNLRDVLDGMGRFALGGMVRAPLAIPAFAGGGMNAVTINFPGLPEITGLRASSAVVDELRKAAAMAQVRSGGRKPSRYT